MLQPRSLLQASTALFVVGLPMLALAQAQPSPKAPPTEQAGERETLDVPTVDIGLLQIDARAAEQKKKAAASDVRHDFRFTDQLQTSGIRFEHRMTEDGGRRFKMVHYDHGNAISVADVDGDSRLDIYLVSQLGGNELWRSLGGGKFEDVTAVAGIALEDRVSVAASFADVDNDGDADLFVTTVRMGNVLFLNDGSGRFTDVTEAAGLSYVGHSSGAVFFDYDVDGYVDLFVTNVGRYTHDEKGPGGYYLGMKDAFQGHLMDERAESSVLYRNLGDGRFVDVSEATGLVDKGWAGDASAADLNADGFPDLYVLNMQGDDHYYENQGGKTFVEKTAEYFPKTPWGAMGIRFFDYDNDGRQDLIVTDMHSDMSIEVLPAAERQKSIIMWDDDHLQGGDNNIFGNAFYRNTGKPPFAEVSDQVQAENYWPWGVSTGDVNADGYEDVLITASMSYPYRYGINSLLLNQAGESFLHAEFVVGIEPRQGDPKIPLFELDCSSAEELAWERHERICAGRRGTYTIRGNLGTRTSVIFDLDDDGDLDIVTSEFNAPPQVLVSSLADGGDVRYLEIELRGTESNRDGLGARVEVFAGDRSQVQVYDGKSGYLSQSSMPLYFGLGGAKPTRIEVRWPSGIEQTVRDGLTPGSTIEIVEQRPPT